MKDSIKNRKKKFLALFLSAMMFSSVAVLAACSDDDADSSSTSSSSSASTSDEKDDGLIKNAGFETFDEDDAINTTVTGWSRSTTSAASGSGLSSKAASGIIDLSADGKKNLVGSYYDDATKVASLTEAEAEAVWDNLTTRDKLAYYAAWEDANEDETISDELDFYESINIDEGDIPDKTLIDGLQTHHAATDEGYGEDYKVLMIHNVNPEPTENGNKTIGTGQKYTSSSTVTVKAGTSAEFSVWVRTYDLKSSTSSGGSQEAVGKGAYISVSHSVGGTELDDYKIENINTEAMGVAQNNGWKQYSFLLKGSSYADTTFTLELGLGQGGGTYRGEYVNGYAFFDDIQCNVISNQSYDEKAVGLTPTSFNAEAKEKIVDASKNVEKDKFALDFYGNNTNVYKSTLTGKVTVAPTTSEINGVNYSSLKGDANVWANLGAGLDGANDVKGVYANATAIQAANQEVYDKYFKDDTTFANEETLLLLSMNGVAYEAKYTDAFTLNSNEYMLVSFFVKTSDVKTFTGAGITLEDNFTTKTSFTAVDTTVAEGVEIDDEKLYGDWQQYFFFIKNDTDTMASFTLTFNFGPTSISSTTYNDYYAGFAAFTNLEYRAMSEEEYESAQGGTYAKTVVISNPDDTESSEEGFDTAKGTPSTDIKTGFANLQNYDGVYFNNQQLTGNVADKTAVNAYDVEDGYAGLLSKKYFTDSEDGYYDATTDWIASVQGNATTAEEAWTNAFGNSTLPLVIWNKSDQTTKDAYGFIGESTNIAANTYTSISVRVRGTVGAKAYLRLIDTNADNYSSTLTAYNQVLSVGRNLTYWYDDDGNIWTGDPDEPNTEIAFRLQSNGLYKANKNWKGYDALGAVKEGFFANLNAYANADGTLPQSDLLVQSGGASHDYNEKWNNEGMTGIAYYYANGKYFADSAKTVEVYNLASVTGLTPRYTAQSAASQTLEQEITLTEGWTCVTFYLHTGDVAKDYRLEVFSGGKDGKGNAAGAYVVFDATDPGTAETNFTNLLDDYKDIDEPAQIAALQLVKLESVFSYFDTAMYLRYNGDIDELGYGNLYEDNYTATAQTEGVAFLKFVEGNEYNLLADFSYNETAVTASAVDDDVEEEEDDSESDTDMNIWLLISSLAVAGVLILAIISIIIRKILVKRRKQRAAQGYMAKPKKEKKSKK